MNKKILSVLAVLLLLSAAAPQASAMDPISMAVLAPLALKAAEAAKPYMLKSAGGMVRGCIKIGKDVFQILYLPWGLGEITIGAPFKKFRSGMVHIIKGGLVAPTRLMIHVIMLPIYMTGANVNI